jgi:hypothetical protein
MTTEEREKLIRFIDEFQAILDADGTERQKKLGKSLLDDAYANGAGFMSIAVKRYLMSGLLEEDREWLSIKEAALLKHKSEQSIRTILHDSQRCKEIFPSARKEGSKERGDWKLLKKEVDAWEPRNYPK